MKTVSSFISYLFHPLLFPTYGALLVLGLNPNLFPTTADRLGEILHFTWVFVVFMLTFAFPAIWIVMMKGLGMIDSLKMETSNERIVSFVATITFYTWATWMFKNNVHLKIATNPLLFYMMIGACISISVAFFMNIFTKVSLHTIGAGSILGLILILVRFSTYDLRLLFVAAIVLGGIIGTARLILKAHSDVEVISGYFIGFTGQFLAFSVVSKFF